VPEGAQRSLLDDVLGHGRVTRQEAGERVRIIEQGLYEVTEALRTIFQFWPHSSLDRRERRFIPKREISPCKLTAPE
jgi:hypothetical protein